MHMSSLVERLASIELFSELTGKEIKKVASYMTTTDVRQGRDLTVQGTTGRDFMIIVDGEASVRRNGRLVATLGPGDFFGELAGDRRRAPYGHRHRREPDGGRDPQPARVLIAA